LSEALKSSINSSWIH